LEDGPPMFRQNFTCSALLKNIIDFYPYGIITHFDAGFQQLPVITIMLLGWSDFARRYFRSLGYLCIQLQIPHKRWVSPFGHLRVKAC